MEQLAAAVQLWGTLVTITGLVVVAPYAVGRVIPDAWRATAGTRNRVRGWFARWIPALRRNVTVNVGVISGSLAHVTGEVHARLIPGDKGSTEEQLAAIRRALDSIYGELDGLRAGQTKLRAELTERLARLEAAQDELRRALEAQQDERSRLDARGIPLAAVGALLAGWPAAWLPVWLAVVLLAAGGMAAYVAVRWLRSRPGDPGAWAEVRKGWREGWAEARPPKPKPPEPEAPQPALTAEGPPPADSGTTAPAEAEDTPEPEATA